MEILRDILSWACLLAGGGLIVITGIGLNRMPDMFTRIHGAGISDTLGSALILLGFAITEGLTLVTLKLGTIMLFLLLTSPVAAHALAKAAAAHEIEPKLGEDSRARHR
jgi:multicomponent Na+:H+ antiporter subunit G